jgi:hypothetical protein
MAIRIAYSIQFEGEDKLFPEYPIPEYNDVATFKQIWTI